MRFRTIFITTVLVLLAAAALAFEPLFSARIDYGVGDWPCSVFAVDLDGDGDNDLAVANYYSDDISILINLSNTTTVCAYIPGDCDHNGTPLELGDVIAMRSAFIEVR